MVESSVWWHFGVVELSLKMTPYYLNPCGLAPAVSELSWGIA